MQQLLRVLSIWLLAIGASADWPEPRPLDRERLSAAGLRFVESQHCTLVTDVASSQEVDQLPMLIDLALPQWAERFGQQPDELIGWKLRAYLIADRSKFESLGLWPNQQTDFPHGLSIGYEIWLNEQASDYYRRHLFLHEATHSYMATYLGSCGPGWYMEAMAELCGTHSWDEQQQRLQLAYFPSDRSAAPLWGRVKLIRNAVASGAAVTLDNVMQIDNRQRLSPTAYSWAWAMAKFLDDHPNYSERFRKLPQWVLSPDFNRRFQRLYANDRDQLNQEWQLFVHTLEYGHDLKREAIDFEQGQPLQGKQIQTVLLADRGWQSSGIRVEAGKHYRLSAEGQFVVGREPDSTSWISEAGGVTLDYHGGRPLGELLATVDSGPMAFTAGTPIGVAADYTPERSGTLYLRVNDAPNRLADNSGELTVTVRVD